MQDKMIQVLKQELFNEIWAGASKQKFERSYDEERDTCLYRNGESGLRCNVGFLIPDDRYEPRIEGSGVSFGGQGSVFSRTTAYDHCITSGFDQAGQDVIQGFLGELQEAHDETLTAADHERRLRSIARDERLEVPA